MKNTITIILIIVLFPLWVAIFLTSLVGSLVLSALNARGEKVDSYKAPDKNKYREYTEDEMRAIFQGGDK